MRHCGPAARSRLTRLSPSFGVFEVDRLAAAAEDAPDPRTLDHSWQRSSLREWARDQAHRGRDRKVGVVCSGGNSSLQHLELALAFRRELERAGPDREATGLDGYTGGSRSEGLHGGSEGGPP